MTSKWVNCPYCGHRMFRWIDGQWTLEVKCTSCKRIVTLKAKDIIHVQPGGTEPEGQIERGGIAPFAVQTGRASVGQFDSDPVHILKRGQ